jgi:hypothetical protein
MPACPTPILTVAMPKRRTASGLSFNFRRSDSCAIGSAFAGGVCDDLVLSPQPTIRNTVQKKMLRIMRLAHRKTGGLPIAA